MILIKHYHDQVLLHLQLNIQEIDILKVNYFANDAVLPTSAKTIRQ